MCLHVEELETRDLPSSGTGAGLLPLVEVEPNDTLDLAQNLGDLSSAGQAAVIGNIGNGATGPTDVDWFQFTLTQAATVTLGTHTPSGGSPLVSVLSLYNASSTAPPPNSPTRLPREPDATTIPPQTMTNSVRRCLPAARRAR